jgi:small GTP-binding protein
VDSKTWDVMFFDTAGQEDYDAMRPLTYGKADVFVLCYGCMNPESLDNIKSKWLPEKNQHAKDVPWVLVGTKIDLRDDTAAKKALMSKTGKGPLYADDVDKSSFSDCRAVKECSAKTGDGVSQVFNEIIKVAIMAKLGGDKKKCVIL